MKRIRNILAISALAAGTLLAGAATAGVPQSKVQAPGYYRFPLGDFEITALSDGTFSLPMKNLLTNITPEKIEAGLARSFQKDPVETSDNAYVINTGTRLVLVDTGSGTNFGPTVGNLANSLRAAGFQPEQIEEIYITHFHGDHIGGLIADGKPVFPNAIVRADKLEADFWLSKERMEAAGKDERGGFEAAMSAINPYLAAGRFKTFSGDTELVPGVRAHASHGHTAGHTTYVVESKGQQLALWGDLMHCAPIQFPDPSVTIRFDTDSVAAASERKKAYADAAAKGYWVAAAHLPFPGVGHLRAEGSGYVFVPANYTSLRIP